MLVAARDEDGTAKVFDDDRFEDVWIRCGVWVSANGYAYTEDEVSKKFCTNIPPGEKRVIDLAASTIVHVAPPKTPVEELVEACEFVDRCKKTDTTDCMRAMRKALARVKEAK